MRDWLYVGSRVVCIDDDYTDRAHRLCRGGVPRRDRIYTIRAVVRDGDAVYLSQIINPRLPPFDLEPSFLTRRFRPVVDRESDISALLRLVEPCTEPVR